MLLVQMQHNNIRYWQTIAGLLGVQNELLLLQKVPKEGVEAQPSRTVYEIETLFNEIYSTSYVII